MRAPLLDATDVLLVRRLQADFPLVDEPYAALARELSLREDELLARLRRLLADGALQRVGPVLAPECAPWLQAAMQVPAERLDAVWRRLCALPNVRHACRRDHRFNLWFVLEAPPHAAAAACRAVEAATGQRVFAFPDERRYGIAPPVEDDACSHPSTGA